MTNSNTKDPTTLTHVVLTNTSKEHGGTGPRHLEFEQDDFVKPVKVKIGDLLSKSTKQSHNSQVIATNSVEVSIRNPDGSPAPLGPSSSVEETYVEQVFESSSEGQKVLAQFSATGNNLATDYPIAKGKTNDPFKRSIDQTIEDINANLGESELAKKIDVKLSSYNKLSPKTMFLTSEDGNEDTNPNMGHSIQVEKGKHTPATWPDSNQGPTSQISIQDLKNIGLQIMLEGSGEIKVPKEKDTPINMEKTQALVSATPGLARLGLRVPYSNFSAGKIMEEVNQDFRSPGSNPFEKDAERLSHGHYNNPLIPFDSLNTTTNRIVSGILILAVSQMIRALGRTINTDKVFSSLNQYKDFGVNNFTNSPPTVYDTIKARMGSSNGSARHKNGTWFLKNPDELLFSRNFHTFGKAVDRGVALFFELGTDAPLGLANPLIRSLTSNTNPGYYNVILRMLINDVNNIFSSLIPAELTSAKGPLEINRSKEISNDPASAILGAFDNTINLIKTLKESKLLRFIDILATIGDLSLSGEGDDRLTSLMDGTPDTRSANNELDAAVYNNLDLSRLIQKNRLSDQVTTGRGNLAWGSNKTPSLYMMPSGIEEAEQQFSNTRTIGKTLSKDLGFKKVMNNRLPPETVDAMEKVLDSSYVPFYFQDLRTNEIISFHAFIEGIDDSFNADYEETSGVGRIGTVLKYKNTVRSLSLSFYIVSTNPQDFDEMWLKINKFVMFLYPQYTEGREVVSDGHKFIQPFSQLVGSSPMIRMRVGDLIKTNHSDFDAARLFGLGTGHFELKRDPSQQEQIQLDQARLQLQNENILKTRVKMVNAEFSIGNRFRMTRPYGNIVEGMSTLPVDLFPGSMAEQLGNSRSKSNPKGNQTGKSGTSCIELPPGTPLTVVSADVANRIYEVTPSQGAPGVTTGQRFRIQFTTNSSDISIDSNDIEFNSQTELANEDATGSIAGSSTNEFFSPANNPIFQSFDSVRGQGLAGFIRSVRIDSSGAPWEVDGLNNRAPKFVKLDITFTPVEDISPGLDSNGFMTGAPYNIGEIMKTLKKKRQEQTQNNSTEE